MLLIISILLNNLLVIMDMIITKNIEDEKTMLKDGKKIKIKCMPAWKFLLDYF